MATKAASVKKSTTSVKVSRSSLKGVGAPLKESAFVGSLLAEVLGTFLLAAMFIISRGEPIILLFALIGIVMMVGNLSGAHLNPAVSIAAWLTKRASAMKAIAYVVAQFAGAAMAFGLLTYFVNGAPAVSEEAAMYGQTSAQLYKIQELMAGKEYYIALAEALGAVIIGFGYAVAFASKKDRVVSSIAAGSSLFIALFIAATAAGYVGGSAVLNPAVAMAVQAFTKVEWWPIAVYALSPIVGAVIGFALYDILNKKNVNEN